VNPITLRGTAKNADTLSVNGDSIPLSPDGTWQKDVLLSNGPNTFAITAKKFLGGATQISEEIFYQAQALNANQTGTSTASSTSLTP
jgi:hypothetical protein